MPPLFKASLINPPDSDPGVYVQVSHARRAFLFDLGELHGLTSKELVKVDYVFVSHTHMDHFIGFDHLLRLLLGRNKKLHIFGPPGFNSCLAGKLSAYTWNLVGNYQDALEIISNEIHENKIIRAVFSCYNGFSHTPLNESALNGSRILELPGFSVNAALLDHGIESVAYALSTPCSININKAALDAAGLRPGPWLSSFKQSLLAGAIPDESFMIPGEFTKDGIKRRYSFSELESLIVIKSKGRKIAYIADTAYTHHNIVKMTQLAKGADHLFIESAFLEKDKTIAESKRHLTAYQAGKIARMAGVKRFTLFHYSPRYHETEHGKFRAEAEAGFQDKS